MFKLGFPATLVATFLTTTAMADDLVPTESDRMRIPTPDMYDMSLTAEEGACLRGLEMMDTSDDAVSEHDGEPLSQKEITGLRETGVFLVEGFCGPTG